MPFEPEFDLADFTEQVRALQAEGDRVPVQREPVDAETLAMIAELKAAHPVESCDLFRTTTGRCTCVVSADDGRMTG